MCPLVFFSHIYFPSHTHARSCWQTNWLSVQFPITIAVWNAETHRLIISPVSSKNKENERDEGEGEGLKGDMGQTETVLFCCGRSVTSPHRLTALLHCVSVCVCAFRCVCESLFVNANDVKMWIYALIYMHTLCTLIFPRSAVASVIKCWINSNTLEEILLYTPAGCCSAK